ncbi:NAD-dependent epimerase/dehydratase family protein [Prochlorococcus sp. MIT 1307]|uniref:NAD-dependent epimerase/dehydratase family protein n=1 Tax=Prochlorococcus sp. MIT 1307 TaxID=3096219 RepID=UPI002A75768F|nr:NAD-dependent epimerase/dehydratase family protein [Prochlorococcus sp. MIT 1307]
MNSTENWFKDKNVLITGASGYLASAICERLYKIANSIIRISRGSLKPKENCTDIKLNIRYLETWLQVLPDVDIIFHLSAQTSIYKAAKDPEVDLIANFTPMTKLIEACRKLKVSPFIVFAGSSTEIGIPNYNPVDESHLEAPITFYDLHKLLSEKLLEGNIRQGIANGTTLRLPNIYGPGPTSSSSDRGVLNSMVLKALGNKPLTVYGEGKSIRDYLYIDDVVDAFIACGKNQAKLNGKHFILGTERGISIYESFKLIAVHVKEITGVDVEVKKIEEPESLSVIESRSFIANTTAFKEATLWEPQVTFETGINKTIRHFIAIENKNQPQPI